MSYIELKNVEKTTKRRKLLSNINLNIDKGEITTIQGINGSGKTLLLKAILGILKTTGEVKVADQIVAPKAKFPVKAGILIENPSVINEFSAYKNLDLLAKLDSNIKEKDILELLEYFNLPDEKVKNFSLGMKQKLGISQAFVGKYSLIILDEPTNALDDESIQKLVDLIKRYNQKYGTTFIIVSHDKDFVNEVSTKKLYIKEGQVYEK
ncbi:ABC transporter ATP-binding protein [Lactobacillus sp. LL6]|uniref:ATP-binding cassette domain-containing protein n=1 Tax=Lactobacillus sp. LL6 TaxID=2596827 RepID=UPI0011871A37|nr:ABC transporter ATP-binding protein [Lactobacillus sp. LL6]TSO26696.1 ABC transporter ATP-binding protein [Lactobacillus sp. LL6]